MASGLDRRARIVLLAAEPHSNTAIGELVGVSRPTVLLWRTRFAAGGVDALGDLGRAGRPRVVSHNEVVVATLTKPPARLGVTHWSSRLLATELGISFATVAKNLAGLGPAALAGGDLQVLHRPRAGRQGP